MQTANQKQGLDVVLLGSATKVVNVKRYELSVQTGTENYFCWGFATRRSMQVPSPSGRRSRSIRSCSTRCAGRCFRRLSYPEWDDGFQHLPLCLVRCERPSDSVWVDIEFRVTAVGVEEEATSVQEFVLFRTPCWAVSSRCDMAFRPRT